jgi:MFS family permease
MGKPLKGLEVLRVLRHPALLRLWLAQIIYLSVQFTASYAMIVLITDETHSATLVGLVIIALSLPLVLFGAPAGALVDRLDRRRILWISNVVRALSTALFVVALLFDPHQYLYIYALAFLFSLVGLFFSPAEGAIIPRLVGEAELLPALSLYNLTLNASQAVGLLLLGPLALDLLPTLMLGTSAHHLTLSPVESLFIILTGLYLIAAGLTASLPREHLPQATSSGDQPPVKAEHELLHALPLPLDPQPLEVELPIGLWKRLRVDLSEGWQLVRKDSLLLDGLWQACFGGLIMLTIAELATTFVQRLLNLPTSDTALIFAPAGIGLVAGSLLVPAVVERLGSTRTMIAGMLGTALGIGLLPLAQNLARFSDPAGWWTDPLFLLSVAGLTALAGLSLDLIIVPAQTRMQERSPDEMRGRVLALYQVLFNGGAIPVMLFMGALTDLLGISAVIDMLVAFSLAAALITLLRGLARGRGGSPPGPRKELGQLPYQAPIDAEAHVEEAGALDHPPSAVN